MSDSHPADEPVSLPALMDQLRFLRTQMIRAAHARSHDLDRVHPRHRRSAENLMHYCELRRHDIRALQDALAPLGLSSLGRAEAHALASVDAVLATLHALVGSTDPAEPDDAVGFEEGRHLLEEHATALFGPAPAQRTTRIMVTLPAEAGDDFDLVARMTNTGMDVARINCAHDDRHVWRRMSTNVRAQPGRPPLVFMDLGGPKLRTGPLEPGPKVRKVRPTRDAAGRVVSPAPVWLVAPGADAPAPDPVVPVADAKWLARRRVDDRIRMVDARDARREFIVVAVEPAVCIEVDKTTYFETGMTLRGPGRDRTVVGELPPRVQAIRLAAGDHLFVVDDLEPAPVSVDDKTAPPRIGCTLPAAFTSARPGHRILFDNGAIEGTILDVHDHDMQVEITKTCPGGAKLRPEKGINLPDTSLDVAALTDDDIEALSSIAHDADAVELSFVRDAADVSVLQQRLAALDAKRLGIVLKIETVSAFEQLPELLLTALASERVGVMIARGDLAVEAGYERLAEIQEEILWLCEAAHVPVIWATEVLDSLAKTGRPSRAEVTDAAMGQRAECVMLNKGPRIDDAIGVLDDILRRMADHHRKKESRLRRLNAFTPGPQR